MSRPVLLIASTLLALPSLSAQQVGAGAVTQAVPGAGEAAANTNKSAVSSVAGFVSDAGSIAKDAVSVDTVENHGGGVVTKTTETLPSAAAGKLSGLLRTTKTLPGGAQVTSQMRLPNVGALVEPPFTNTRQVGRATVSEKSYLPVPLPQGMNKSTEELGGGVTTTTSTLDRATDLRRYYYTRKRLPGGVETYGPPEFLPDGETFAPITRVTETLPGGGTVTRNRSFVSALENPGRIGFHTTSTENGITTRKFHSVLPPYDLSLPGMGDSKVATAPRNPGTPVAGATTETSATQAATSTAGSVLNTLNPLNWGRAIANTTKGALSKGAAAVPSAPNGKWNPAGSAMTNRGNVIRPGG